MITKLLAWLYRLELENLQMHIAALQHKIQQHENTSAEKLRQFDAEYKLQRGHCIARLKITDIENRRKLASHLYRAEALTDFLSKYGFTTTHVEEKSSQNQSD